MADRKKILVVDDEPDIVTYLTTLLEDNGYATRSAKDGQEALASIEEALPDLVTLDITMPEKSGVRFYRDLKENEARRHVPVIMVTGVMAEFEGFISSRRQVPPPEGYLSKPIDPHELLTRVRDLIGD